MNTVRHSVGLYINYHEIMSLYPNASACSNISYSRYISIVNQITTTTAASEMSSFMISLYADIHTLVTIPWGKRVIVSFCSWQAQTSCPKWQRLKCRCLRICFATYLCARAVYVVCYCLLVFVQFCSKFYIVRQRKYL